MATRQVIVVFDDLTDVVSAYLKGTRAKRMSPAPADLQMVFEYDGVGEVVGVQVQGASVLVPPFWKRHPDRMHIPTEILMEIDGWLNDRWTKTGKQSG